MMLVCVLYLKYFQSFIGHNTKRESGKKAQLGNIQAAKVSITSCGITLWHTI